MPASLDDILTSLKLNTAAINAQTQNNTILAGSTDFWNITSAKVIKASPGRIVRISLIAAGSAAGTIYDATSTTDTSRPIYSILTTSTGVTLVDLPCQYGIVIAPGTSQAVSGSFS